MLKLLYYNICLEKNMLIYFCYPLKNMFVNNKIEKIQKNRIFYLSHVIKFKKFGLKVETF